MLVLAALLAGLAGRACGQTSAYELLIEESPSKAGTVLPNSGTHRFGANTTVRLSADPQPGYQFAYWLGDVSDPKAPRTTVKVNESKVIVAVFRPAETKRPEEEVKTSGGGGGGLGSGALLVNPADLSAPGWSPSGGGGGGIKKVVVPVPVIVTPEPSTIALLGLGALALRRRRR